MTHRRRLRRKEQSIDSRFLHALELSLHRAFQLLIADLELGSRGLAKIGNLPSPVGLPLQGSGGEMGVGVNDHKFLLRPLKKAHPLRCTRSTRSNVPARVRPRLACPERSRRIDFSCASHLDLFERPGKFFNMVCQLVQPKMFTISLRLSLVMLSAIGRLISNTGASLTCQTSRALTA